MSSDAAPPEARRTPNANVHATPQSNRSLAGSSTASASTRNLNQASSSNLAAQAASQSSPSTMRVGKTSQVTVESALAQANGSYEVALAQVVDERNAIYNQNTMLWKHVEKTKGAAASYKKDLERIRAERDRALARIQQLTGEEPRPRPSTQRNGSVDTLPPTHTERPVQPVRHLSDAGSNVSSGSISEPPLSQSQPTAPKGPPPSVSLTQFPDSSVPFDAENRALPTPPPTVSTSVIPPTPTKRSQTDPVTPPRSNPQPPTPTNVPRGPRPRADSSPARSASGPQYQTYAPSNAPIMLSVDSANSLTPDTVSAGDPHKVARDSRITLPDETSRYLNYSHLIDSPMSSPGPGATTMPTNVQREGSSPPSPLRGVPGPSQEEEAPVPGPSKITPPSASPPGEFVDLKSTDDGEFAANSSQEPAAVAQQLEQYPVPSSVPKQQFGKTGGTVAPAGSAPPRPPRRPRSVDAIGSSHTSSQGSAVEPVPSLEVRVSSDTTARSISGTGSTVSSTTFSSSPHAHSNYAPQAMTPTGPQHQQPQRQQQQYSRRPNSQQQQESPPAPSYSSASDLPRIEYKAAKLTNDDLAHTVIRVDGSAIRSNDRGKEVLSFLISVIVKGREPWKVEKLYSDVLTLDGRVRVGASKTQGKKIAPLPDNKLFKDNAPAKVDQRKAALEVYLQSLVLANLKTRDDVCMFFSTGITRPEREPVHQLGHKEGYLTKRSKNFGGFLRWKTRYFVLQGSTLEYYESRGGQHLGSISILNAQIGRQQKVVNATDEDENAFRHAFLIIEAKKPPATSPSRHVLCAESDAERDNWVDALVRHVAGETYGGSDSSDPPPYPNLTPINTHVTHHIHHSPSTSSFSSPTEPRRHITKDRISRPISSLPPASSEVSNDTQATPTTNHVARTIMAGQYSSSENVPLSSSLPDTTNPLSAVNTNPALLGMPRANSEMGHYPDMTESRVSTSSNAPGQLRVPQRSSFHPSLQIVKVGMNPSPTDTVASDATPTGTVPNGTKKQISAPINGTPIPPGFNFGGGKDAAASDSSGAPGGTTSERDRKTKSSHFWPFGGGGHGKSGAGAQPRVVFGAPIAEALIVAQIANLPSVVFRCIQYLETKHAEREEGIYRLSGSSAVIKALKDRFNTTGDVDLLNDEEYWDPHAVAGLLKTYFRELPTTILTHERHFRFLKVIDLANVDERINELANLIAALPFANYCLLRALSAHLIRIVQNSPLNKMTVRNVGIVFSPTLGIPAGVFSLMLSEFPRVFGVCGVDDGDALTDATDELVAAGSGEMEGEATPRNRDNNAPIHPSKRNSVGYAEASADRLLGLAGRTLTTPEEEDDSNDEYLLVQEESDIDTEETQSAPEDESADMQIPSTPTSRTMSHGAAVAATRGLQIRTDRPRHVSQPLSGPGLPASPRPMQKISITSQTLSSNPTAPPSSGIL